MKEMTLLGANRAKDQQGELSVDACDANGGERRVGEVLAKRSRALLYIKLD